MIDLLVFRHRIVRDLAWVIASPPLVSGDINGVHWWHEEDCLWEYRDCLDALLELDADPSPLQSEIDTLRSHALGHRFECLVDYWLTISPNYSRVARNIQLNEERRTIGELDFLIRDLHSDEFIHLEVAVKFYMGFINGTEMSCWYGNNLHDRLDKKFGRLSDFQTQLSQLHPDKIPGVVDRRYCWLKGRLFYPESTAMAAPDGCAASHLRGVWGESVDAHLAASDGRLQAHAIGKSGWLSAFTPSEVSNHPQATRKDHHAQCYLIYDQQAEVERYFQRKQPDISRFQAD